MNREFDRKIVFADGREFYGFGFGAARDALCEIVFNTSMVGYQEIISDPSYTDQAVTMTYPLIGNYGITDEDYETKLPSLGALIVRECNDSPSNFRYTKTLSEALEDSGIPGISGVDTRQITRIIRDEGTQKVLLTSAASGRERALEKLADFSFRHDAVSRVSCKKRWYARTPNARFNVATLDCGIKLSIVRSLNAHGCNVTVLPYNTTAEQIRALSPDGLLLSNGPGDPEDVPEAVGLVRDLRGELPIFGICLGHQIISLAFGAKTYKMKFGHRGANHPVKNLATGKLEIPCQNHSFAVDPRSLAGTDLKITHRNLLDDTVEGAACPDEKVISVQYDPESSAGPRDISSFFSSLTAMMEAERALCAERI